jgi:hypothetical protein
MNTNNHLFSFLISFFFLLNGLHSQEKHQTISGVVYDQATNERLIGALVSLFDSTINKQVTTDADGRFSLENIPVGRIRLSCSYLAYKTLITPSFVLNSSRSPYLELEMEESSIEISTVVVAGKVDDGRTQNEMIYLNGRSFSAEETERYAGSIADPSRMAVSFAGVQASNDINNDIVIRGNSSVGVLWRLEGIDIPNPNHFSRRGSSGGGISVFSVNMLRSSDFIYGAAPAEYGNAIAGVFDMKFRKGNQDRRESSFRAGLLGIDAVTEGPIKKGKSSYLVNARYSTLGILNQFGVHIVDANTDNTFADIAYHVYLPSKNNKNIIQLWGLGGYSSEFHHPVPDQNDVKVFEDLVQTDFKTSMGATGVNYTRLIDKDRYLKIKLAFTSDKIIHNKDTVDINYVLGYLSDEEYKSSRLTTGFDYYEKFSPSLQMKLGASVSFQGFDFLFTELDRGKRFEETYLDHHFSLGSQRMGQAYIQLNCKLSDRFSLSSGLSALHQKLSNKYSINPQVSGAYQLNSKSQLAFSVGKYAQAIPFGSYFTHEENEDLDLMRSAQANLTYSTSIKSNYKINIELYYQRLSNIPMSSRNGLHYWMLNELVGYSRLSLNSDGLGKNYGVELSIEKFFSRGLFFYVSGSLYSSEYSLGDDQYYSSRYDGNFNSSLMVGKEFTVRENSIFQISFRNLYYGGQYYSPPNTETSQRINNYYIDNTSALTLKNKDYLRSDLRLSYRKNKNSSSWILALDIQNLFNIYNTRDEIWNIQTSSFENRSQVGLIPVISFQVDY